tara:strand:- start:375 stop:503 length:129 start_codon:yes stop_codon:yes gene_type:complete
MDLILNGGRRKSPAFQIVFEKMLSFFGREINIFFKFGISKKK